MKSFRIFAILVMAAAIGLPAYADEPSRKTREALRQEFEWLRAEAAATVTVATKTKMNIDDAPSVVSVITEEQIKNSGAKNLEEVLGQVAGIHLHKDPSYPDTYIGIRGIRSMGNAGVKIMINGHSMENSLEQNITWTIAIPTDLIKKIEIIRGPGSALYGNAAMNGVINIITKDGKDPSAVSAGYGSFDTYKGTAQLSYLKNDFSLFFFADHIKSNGDPQLIEKDAASAMFPPGASLAPGYSNEDFSCSTFFTKLSYKNVYLTGLMRDDKRKNPAGISLALTDENNIPDKGAFAEAGYEGALTDKIRLSAKAYYDYGMQKLTYEIFDQKTAALFDFPKGQSVMAYPESQTDKFGSEIMTTVSVSDSLEFVLGTSLEYVKTHSIKSIDNANITEKPIVLDGVTYMPMEYFGGVRDISDSYNYLDPDRTKRRIYAFYAQGTWNMMKAFSLSESIGKTLMLTAGLRYDNYDDVGDTLNPRLGFVYAPNNTLFFKLLYGEAFRAPGFDELYYTNNPSVSGNPNLKSETVRTMEMLGGIHLTEHITATLDFFRIEKKDAIRIYNSHYLGRGEVESQGVEGEIRASFDKHRYGYFNVTFQKVKDVTHDVITDIGGTAYTQQEVNGDIYSQIMANLGVNTHISRYVNANVWLHYIGSTDRIGTMRFTSDKTDPDGTVEKLDKRNPTESYALMNFSLVFHNFDFAKGWELQLTGYNIFDTDYTDPESSKNLFYDTPRSGRSFFGKISYTF
ncbi:MAG TPA: hypothetical protein DCQ37_13400 [Desulfobacteraceae bacterium]|nr:hypothetical protein [Desulfobacteraceae bacterium]